MVSFRKHVIIVIGSFLIAMGTNFFLSRIKFWMVELSASL